MRLFTFFYLVIVCFAMSVSASAATEKLSDEQFADAVVEYNQQVLDDDDEVVCKNERVTGSRFKKRICRTKGQMREEKESLRRLRNRKSGAIGNASTGSSIE